MAKRIIEDRPLTIFKCINKNFVGGIDQGVQEKKTELDNLPILCGSLNLNPQKTSTEFGFGELISAAEVNKNYFAREAEAKIDNNLDKESNENYFDETANLGGHSLNALGNLVGHDTDMPLNLTHFDKGAIPKQTRRDVNQNYFARAGKEKIGQNYFNQEAREDLGKSYFDETVCSEVVTNVAYSPADISVGSAQSNENAEANLFGHYAYTAGEGHSLNALGNLVCQNTGMPVNPVHYNKGAIPKQTRRIPGKEDNLGGNGAKLPNIHIPIRNPENEENEWVRMEVYNLQPSVKKTELKNMIILQVGHPVTVKVIAIQKVKREGNVSKIAIVDVLGKSAAQKVAKAITQYQVEEKYYEVRFL